MILKLYENFKEKFINKEDEAYREKKEVTVPTSKRERLSVNEKAKKIIAKASYTEEDIEILKQYTGFGGLGMGDKDEYFTPKALASAMVDIVDLQDGQTLLDPCTGGGIFPMVAKEKADLNIIAVEPNPLSAKVSSAILGVDVENGYFEDYKGNKKVDAIITNVPFGVRPKELIDKDPILKGINRTEDYIIFKSLQHLKEGGMGVFITNSRLMNGKSKVKDGILLQGEVLGAVRLPNSIFADSGADVVTDIVVIKKHKNIIIEMSKEDRRKYLIEPFNLGEYFQDNPNHIIGEYTSKEEAVAIAEANGDKIHHMAQKDTVTTDLTHDEVFARANEIMKSFKPKINYDELTAHTNKARALETIEREKEEVRVGNEIKEAYSSYVKGEGVKIDKLKKIISDHSRLNMRINEKTIERFIGAEKLYELGIDNQLVISKLIGAFYSSDSKVSNIITKDEWDDNKNILIPIAENKPSWASKIWIFKNVLTAYKKYNKASTKKLPTVKPDKKNSISDYTEDEIINNTVMEIDGKVIHIEDAHLELDGMTEEMILSSLNTDIVSDKRLDEYTKKVHEFIDDNIAKINPKNITIDLVLASKILGSRQLSIFLSRLEGLKSLEKNYEDNVINNIKENNYLKGEEVSIDPIKEVKAMLKIGSNRGIIHNFTKEILLEDKEPRFMSTWNVSERTKEALAMVARTEFYNLQDIVTSLLRTFVDESSNAKAQLEEWAKSKSIFIGNKIHGDEKLTEIDDLVRAEWLENSHHYQNSDARKFSESEDGVIRYDTGLGKSLEAMLVSAKLIKKGKKVAYIVPNEIIGKMEAEVKKIFSAKMLKQTLVVTSDDKKSILEAVSNKKYKFLLMTSSVLTTQFHLLHEVTHDLFGKSIKAKNAGEKSKYKISMRDFVSRQPKWDSKSSYSFEDLGLDTMIIDESHRFKNAVASASSGVKGLTTSPSNVALIMLYFAVYTKYVKRGDGKGVILSTATPITSSPTEMLTTLLFSVDVENMKSMGVKGSLDFEETFFKIVKKDIMKTDGSMRNGKILEGIKNLDILRNLGYRKVVKRTAEEESLVAKQNGKEINVKPSSTEIRVDVDDSIGKNSEFGEALNNEFEIASLMLSNIETRGITEDDAVSVAVLREFGSMFSYLDKYKKSSISIPTALGYTQIDLEKKITEDELLSVIGAIKVKHKIVETTDGIFELDIKYKIGTVEIKDYDKTEFMMEKIDMFDKYCLPLLEKDGKTVNIPSIEYDTVKKVLNALKKKKIKLKFESDKYPKISTLVDTALEQFVAFPKSKQIIYATTLSTHIIIENLITQNSKDKIKFFHFNGSTVKNAEKKMKMQNDFNDFNGKAVLIFGSSGKVGVDFNKNVSSVHLLDVGLTPEDKEQAKGRAVRQGNKFNNVSVFNYYQNNTLDSFLEGIVGNKQEWINSVENIDVSSSTFNSDTLETIARLAEKKYKGEKGTVEQKIKKYLKFTKEEQKRKAKILEKTFTDQSVAGLLSMQKEYFVLTKGYSDLERGAYETAKSKFSNYVYSRRLLSSTMENLYLRELKSHAQKTADYLLYDEKIQDENKRVKKATLNEVKEALTTSLYDSQIEAMNNPAKLMKGTLKDSKKLTKAFNKESYENLFFEIVKDKYNELIEKIEAKAESMQEYGDIIPKRIKELKVKLSIEDTIEDVIISKLKEYDGEYLHGQKGKLITKVLRLGSWSSSSYIGEAYLNYYKMYEYEVEAKESGVILNSIYNFGDHPIIDKTIDKEELAKKMTQFEVDEQTKNRLKSDLIKEFEKFLS